VRTEPGHRRDAAARPGPWLTLTVAACIWLAVTVSSLALRPLLPVDELRYLSVAWEMWWRGDFLVPHLNGEPYSDKPPLLFWLIDLIWLVTGVNETAARLVPAMFTLGNAGLVVWLARTLWPARSEIATIAPLILLGSTVYALYGTLVLFDMLLGLFVLLGVGATVKVARTTDWRWWALYSVAVGGGTLAKGPVALLHVLPVALLAPLWTDRMERRSWRRWYASLALAVAAGSAIALAWALSAASAGGPEYAAMILWRQTAGRVAASFAHARPWWFYLAVIPVLLYPWVLVPAIWRGAWSVAPADRGVRVCLTWGGAALAGLMVVSGKQLHYLLPLVPAFALLAGRAVSEVKGAPRMADFVLPAVVPLVLGLGVVMAPALFAEALRTVSDIRVPAWLRDLPPAGGFALVVGAASLALVPRRRSPYVLLAAAGGTALLLVTANTVGYVSIFHLFDLTDASRHLGAHQDQPIAYNKDYEGEFGFLGRLTRPIVPVYEHEMKSWLDQHRGARVVVRHTSPPSYIYGEPVFEQAYRGHRLGIWLAPAGTASGAAGKGG
jgi:4-amino-4-deoxy-L-arabinose transferase-like glycosyltransferase